MDLRWQMRQQRGSVQLLSHAPTGLPLGSFPHAPRSCGGGGSARFQTLPIAQALAAPWHHPAGVSPLPGPTKPAEASRDCLFLQLCFEIQPYLNNRTMHNTHESLKHVIVSFSAMQGEQDIRTTSHMYPCRSSDATKSTSALICTFGISHRINRKHVYSVN